MTKKEFLKGVDHAELYSKVIEFGGVDWSDLIEHPDDYYTANSGSVPGTIWTEDCEQFAKENIEDILMLYSDFTIATGTPLTIDTDNPLQWLTYFTWESMMGDLMSFLDV